MGNCGETPINILKEQELAETRETTRKQNPYQYPIDNILWLDQKVTNQENQSYYRILKKFYSIQCFTSLVKAKLILQSLSSNDRTIVICSASFSNPVYDQLSRTSKVQEVILFCMNQIKAKELKKSYSSKIKYAAHEFEQLEKYLKGLYKPKARMSLKNKQQNKSRLKKVQDNNKEQKTDIEKQKQEQNILEIE